MKKLTLTIKTPTRVIVDKKEVDFVTLPGFLGEIGVLYNHAPLMVELKEGILKYRNENDEEYFAIYWGFAQVFNNNVIVLAEDASLSSEIDAQKLTQQYEYLRSKLTTKEDIEDIEIKLKKIAVDLRLSNIIKRKQKR
ncbi:MAG: ATP synthase F1 subunit epsilon [Elusimicrobiales bacterium]